MLRFLLAIDAPQIRETMREAIEAYPDMEVAAEANGPLELLFATGRFEADVVVLADGDPERLPSVATHLFAEYPGVQVLVVSPERRCAVAYRQEVCAERFADTEFADLLVHLHVSDAGYFAPR
jgi:DNA-binding NarL/FixJ family response regulator